MPYYRKKPVVVEAVQLPEEGESCPEEVLEWIHENVQRDWTESQDGGLVIHTLEGDMKADPCDFIIKGVQGECYPCKPDIFHATYNPVKLSESAEKYFGKKITKSG